MQINNIEELPDEALNEIFDDSKENVQSPEKKFSGKRFLRNFFLRLKENVLDILEDALATKENNMPVGCKAIQEMYTEIINDLSNIKSSKCSYRMTLDYNTYAQANMGYIEIPKEDMDQYGTPISAMFKGKSSAPGNAYLSVGNDNKVYGYATCVDGTGTLIVTFLNTAS